jgi:hypothetical protein
MRIAEGKSIVEADAADRCRQAKCREAGKVLGNRRREREESRLLHERTVSQDTLAGRTSEIVTDEHVVGLSRQEHVSFEPPDAGRCACSTRGEDSQASGTRRRRDPDRQSGACVSKGKAVTRLPDRARGRTVSEEKYSP